MGLLLALCAAALAGCSVVSFGPRRSDDELRLMAEVRSFYGGQPRGDCLKRRVSFDELGYSRAATRVVCELPGGARREERHELARERGRWRIVSRDKP